MPAHQRIPDADARRRLDASERYRAMWDAIEFKRKMVDTVDNKAKLALTIMGALNAAVFFALFRGGAMPSVPDDIRPWFAGMMVVYGLVTFGFIVQTIEALRPRTESRALVLEQARRETPEPLGLFMPHGRRPALAEELRRWRGATAGDVSAELASLNLAIAGMLERQVVALERVYRGLRVLLALAAAMLAFAGAMWWLRPPG